MNSDIILTSVLDQAGEVIPIGDQRFFNRNVRIPSGNHIIVEFGGNLRMNENASITVESGAKLEVRNNGMITTNSCVPTWNGIVVHGALNVGVQPDHSDNNLIWNNSGVVHIHNGGKIYNAEVAIGTYAYSGSFTPFTSFTGAIYLDDAELMDNEYGVIISRKSVTPIVDKSFILHSEISNGLGGVRMGAINSFRIEDTNIMNMSEYGISATASDVTIENNNMIDNCNTGIYLSSPFPGQTNSPRVGNLALPNNRIRNNSYAGIRTDGVNNNLPLLIQNNLFTSNILGNINVGESLVSFTNNRFNLNAVGSAHFTNGSNQVFITSNEIDNSNYAGIWSVNDNRQLRFLSNCFSDGGNYDVKMANGTVADQGNPVADATNCYSKNGIPELDGVNITSVFDYYRVPDVSQCFYPEPKIFYSDIDTDFYGGMLCGLSTPNIVNSSPDTCTLPDSIIDIEHFIDSLESEIDTLLTNPLLSSNERDRREIELKECLKRAYLKYISVSVENNDFTSIITKPLTSRYFDIRIWGLSQSLFYESPSTSRQRTSSLNASAQEEYDFVTAIDQYINWLSEEDYKIDQSDLTDIYHIGLKYHAYSGYARSIYFILTGQIINPTLPPFPVYSGPRSVKEENGSYKISVFPNPSSNEIKIMLSSDEVDDQFEIEFYNNEGRVVKQATTSNKELKISIEDLSPGIYFIKVNTKAGKVMQSKFVKI
ncbi:MAG: hypothetical protein ACJATI_002482 [Halioglobus sp.]|jgi:hypothetical protein